jgi:hypothetical protein
MTGAALLVVGTVCISALMLVGTLCYCVAYEVEVPEELKYQLGLVFGGLLALLAKTWAEKPAGDTGEQPQPVEVVQPHGDPIPVVESPAPKDDFYERNALMEPEEQPVRRKPRKRITPVRSVSIGAPSLAPVEPVPADPDQRAEP